MSDPTPSKQRRRWITIGEIVAVAGLIISALALWNSWRNDNPPATAAVDQRPRPIPLALRGSVEDSGKTIRLTPVEAGHALEGVTLTAVAPASGTAKFGSEPNLSAAQIETWLPKDTDREADGAMILTADARYIEHGEARTARQRYRVSFRWVDGGLFGGKSVRLADISRI